MQLNITVIQNEQKSAMSKANKPYKLCELAYKNLDSGKVESTKINQYSDLFKQVCDMQAGMSFSVTKEKVGDFWNWVKVEILQPSSVTETKASPVGTFKPTYETPEERAKKQVYIVKQSSIGHAIEMLSIGAKTPLAKENVLLLAQQLTEWVLSSPPFDDVGGIEIYDDPQVS